MDPDSSRFLVTVTDGRGRSVRDEGLARWVAAVAPARVHGEVAIALVPDAQVRALNRRYRRKDAATDVLSFPSGNVSAFLGDIVIATGVARRQARRLRHAYRTELRVLALHGLLHLLGYDHEDRRDRGRMSRVEARLRRKGGLPAGLTERGKRPRPERGCPPSLLAEMAGEQLRRGLAVARQKGWRAKAEAPASAKK